MAWPLVILASIVLVLGFFQANLERFLLTVPGAAMPGEGHNPWLIYVSMVFVFAGVSLAWFEFGRKGSTRVGFVERIRLLKALFAQRWYLDHFYRLFLEYVVYRTFARLFTRNESQVINSGIDGLSRLTVSSGRVLSYLQSGMLRYNLMVMFAVLALVGLYFILA